MSDIPLLPVLTNYANRKKLSNTQTNIMMNELLKGAKPFSSLGDVADNVFMVQVFRKRLEAFDINISEHLFVLLLEECLTPAIAVMWTHTLNAYKNEYPDLITCNFLADHFPMGLPDNAGYDQLWTLQKGTNYGLELDNMFDSNQIGYKI